LCMPCVTAASQHNDGTEKASTPPSQTSRKMRTRRPGQWCWLDTAIVATYGPQIGAYGVAVYVALAAHANGKTQACWPSIGRLASELKLSRPTVKRTLRKLREVGLIASDPRQDPAGDPTSNRYVLLDPSAQTSEISAPLADVSQGSRVLQTPPSDPEDPTGRVSETPKPDPTQPEERTSKPSDVRSALGREEPKDETPPWNTSAPTLPDIPADRPDDQLQQLPVDPETFVRLYRTAVERLNARGTKRDLIIVPMIHSEMLAVYEEEYAPCASGVAA
jgi:DNA-binding transcriptional ArsR family regulator